jgi:2-polyprenyl-3-methyl-5-hydroxy-6-metoxy-1,4-benzoquinol methylase
VATEHAGNDTAKADYAERLQRLETVWWKKLLDVQAPYRWNVRRLQLGRTLDVGCGLGRNLAHLGGDGVGVDHNIASVEACRAKGFVAYTADEFADSPDAKPEGFDSLLLAHVVEHMPEAEAEELVTGYLDYVRPGGKVVFFTPQERGYASDATHVRWVGFAELADLAERCGLTVTTQRSFPFPRPAGKVFTYNEFNVVTTRP